MWEFLQSAKRHHLHYIFHAVFARFPTVAVDFLHTFAALSADILHNVINMAERIRLRWRLCRISSCSLSLKVQNGRHGRGCIVRAERTCVTEGCDVLPCHKVFAKRINTKRLCPVLLCILNQHLVLNYPQTHLSKPSPPSILLLSTMPPPSPNQSLYAA